MSVRKRKADDEGLDENMLDQRRKYEAMKYLVALSPFPDSLRRSMLSPSDPFFNKSAKDTLTLVPRSLPQLLDLQ